MLYRPVYIKTPRKTHEVVIPEGRPPPSPPSQPPLALPDPIIKDEQLEQVEGQEELSVTENEEDLKRLPLLIASYKLVIPQEAARDVLSGRVPYLLVDDEGITVFKPAHLFAALKLDKNRIERFEDYRCVGAYERQLAKPPKKRIGLGYRRKYISPELIGRGIYVSYHREIWCSMYDRIELNY